MNAQIIQDLSQSLQHFGLNPGDWIVFRLNQSRFAAISKDESQLILAGNILKNEQSWAWAGLEYVDV